MPWLDVAKIMKAERSKKWVAWRRTQSGTGLAHSLGVPSDGANGRALSRDRRDLIPELGLREYWWPAVEAKKVPKRRPLGVRLLGEDLVFFRGNRGEVKAIWNVCAHRGGSLADGHCHYPGTVSCPYHGWTYNENGEVAAVLSEGPNSLVPGKVRTRVFPTTTLRGMVFVWMGEGEPAPIEEDVPPEFFRDNGVVYYTTEYWPLNWRVALENALDAHAAYLHRDSALVLMVPIPIVGPVSRGAEIVSGRAAVRPRVWRGSGPNDGTPARQPPSQEYLPAVDGKWPKTRYRTLWGWMFSWNSRRRSRKGPVETDPEWAGMLQHLPSMVRLDYNTHAYTRCSIPVDKDLTREIYFHYAPSRNRLAKAYEWLHFRTFHQWAMMTNFSQQDLSASAPQRYDTREYLSSTDAQLVSWRKLLMHARGMDKSAVEALPTQESELFYSQRQQEAGLEAEAEAEPAPVQGS